MRQFQRVPGVLVEPVGMAWAAFSPLSGETILLNNESAAVLEVLEAGPACGPDVVAALADDCGLAPSDLAPIVSEAWARLVEAGLVTLGAGDDNAGP